jgi:hypothetical protein
VAFNVTGMHLLRRSLKVFKNIQILENSKDDGNCLKCALNQKKIWKIWKHFEVEIFLIFYLVLYAFWTICSIFVFFKIF